MLIIQTHKSYKYLFKRISLLEGARLAIKLSYSIINICTDSLSALNNRKHNFHSNTITILIQHV